VHEFIVPYCLPVSYIDFARLNTSESSMGLFEIYVLNPLRVTSKAPDISVTVFMNLEKVELAGMTIRDYFSPETLKLSAQGIIQEALEKSEKEVVVGVKESGGVSGSFLTRPIVDRVARTSAKFVNNMVRSTLGFCKPPDLSSWAPRILRNYNLAPGVGLEPANSLGLHPDNMVATNYELVGSNPDEMKISYICSTPALVDVSEWNEHLLYRHHAVTPMNCYAKDVTKPTPGKVLYHTPLSFTTNAFHYWRGSIKICVQVTCSAFHSGRLRIYWEPSITTGETVPAEEPANCVNHIMDIQSETEYYVTIPYLHNTPWLQVSPRIGQPSQTHNGQLRVEVLNALTHPETPVPPVYINIWLAAGEDFQLAWPKQSNLNYKIYNPTALKAQGLTREQMRMQSYPPIIQPASGAIDDGILMGEQVLNLKELIMRPGKFDFERTYDGHISNDIGITHPCFPYLGKTEVDCYEFKSYFSMLFRYSRGSVNFKYIVGPIQLIDKEVTTVAHVYKAHMTVTSVIDNDIYKIHREPLDDYNDGSAVVLQPEEKNVEVTVPYYSRYYNNISTLIHKENGYEYPALRTMFYTEHTAKGDVQPLVQNIISFRSAGDDFIMGFIVAPPMQLVEDATLV